MAVAESDVRSLDVGNGLLLDHLNMTVTDQLEATQFYVVGLGLTRDPYGAVGTDNMHVNAGESQFHLPTRATQQTVAGHIGLVIPDLEALERRLEAVHPRLAHTRMAWNREGGELAVTCPWGNSLRCYAPSARFGSIRLGIPYIEIQTRPGAADAVARFYREVLRIPASVETDTGGRAAHVAIGRRQRLIFRESPTEPGPCDGYHVAIYIADFSDPYAFLKQRGLTGDVRNHQFRFKSIVDPESGQPVHELDHEVRSLHHPQFGRSLINRELVPGW